MASMSTGFELDEVTTAQLTEMSRTVNDDQQNTQMNLDNPERDNLAITREKRLFLMSRLSIVTACIAVFAIVVGLLAILTSDSLVPYSLGGGIIAGGMALLMTICPLCMFLEGKKTKTGTKMTGLFKCCLISMLVWFSFSLCGILTAFGIPGIWGMLECMREKQKPSLSFRNICTNRTNEKLLFSVLTFVLSAILFVLMIAINCLFCCNPKAFGYKTMRQRNYEFYSGMNRREARRVGEEQTSERNYQDRRPDRYQSNRTNRQQGYTSDRQDCFIEHEREYPREPSAPPLEDNAAYRNNRGQQYGRPPQGFQPEKDRSGDGFHPQRAHVDSMRIPESRRHHPRESDDEMNRLLISNEDSYHPERSLPYNRHELNSSNINDERGATHGQTSRFVNQRENNERDLEDDSEAPPPSYDEVVIKLIRNGV